MAQKNKEERKPLTCPECKSTVIIKDENSGEYVCGNCGLVVEEIFDEKKEWRAYSLEQEERRTRAGPPLANWLHDRGLTTVIKETSRDAHGKMLSPLMQYEMRRLKKQQARYRIASSEERNLSYACYYIDMICDREVLPKSIRENAAEIYRKALKEGVRGRTIKAMATASVYAACRMTNNPRSLKDFKNYCSPKEIAKYYRVLLKELDLPIPMDAPLKHILKIGEKEQSSEPVKNLAIKIANAAREANYTSGKAPRSIAAACLYMASTIIGERRTQRDIADDAGVTEVTLRNRYKDLMEILDLKFEL